jgi:hypothetical protein
MFKESHSNSHFPYFENAYCIIKNHYEKCGPLKVPVGLKWKERSCENQEWHS